MSEALSTPDYEEKKVPQPEITDTKQPAPEVTDSTQPVPEVTDVTPELPKFGHLENVVKIGNEEVELKPTKMKYQRDRTAAFYRILQQMSLVDILALRDGMLDPDRSSDKMVFDWLIAVTDDPKLVVRNYDAIDSDQIEQILHVFCRLNHIDEREERKNRMAQEQRN